MDPGTKLLGNGILNFGHCAAQAIRNLHQSGEMTHPGQWVVKQLLHVIYYYYYYLHSYKMYKHIKT